MLAPYHLWFHEMKDYLKKLLNKHCDKYLHQFNIVFFLVKYSRFMLDKLSHCVLNARKSRHQRFFGPMFLMNTPEMSKSNSIPAFHRNLSL